MRYIVWFVTCWYHTDYSYIFHQEWNPNEKWTYLYQFFRPSILFSSLFLHPLVYTCICFPLNISSRNLVISYEHPYMAIFICLIGPILKRVSYTNTDLTISERLWNQKLWLYIMGLFVCIFDHLGKVLLDEWYIFKNTLVIKLSFWKIDKNRLKNIMIWN